MKALFVSADNHLIDTLCGIIMNIEVRRAIRHAEVGASRAMLGRSAQSFGIKPRLLAGDTTYGSANCGGVVNGEDIESNVLYSGKSKAGDRMATWVDFAFGGETNS